MTRNCSVPGCGRPHNARVYCSRHYRQWLRTGSPMPRLRLHPANPRG